MKSFRSGGRIPTVAVDGGGGAAAASATSFIETSLWACGRTRWGDELATVGGMKAEAAVGRC